MTAPSRKFIETRLIRLDGDTQPREQIDEATVADYAEAMRDGANFPAVTVFNDGSARWLADGFHRFHATRAAGLPTILVEEHAGSRRDAVLYGFQANIKHGLRETRADKRRKIEVMLRDAEWVSWSDREIARKCGVDHKTVSAARCELVGRGEIPHVDTRTDSAGRQQPAARAPAPADIPQKGKSADSDTLSGQPVTESTEPTVEVNVAPPAPASSAPMQDEPRLYQEGASVSAYMLVANAIHAISQISERDRNAVTAIKDLQAAVARKCAAIGMPADAEVERRRAENAELREQLAELASNLEEAVAEIEVLHRVTKADDQIKAALTEASRVNEHNRVLEERIRGLAGENVEAIRLVKSWKRKAEAAEKLLKAKG